MGHNTEKREDNFYIACVKPAVKMTKWTKDVSLLTQSQIFLPHVLPGFEKAVPSQRRLQPLFLDPDHLTPGVNKLVPITAHSIHFQTRTSILREV